MMEIDFESYLQINPQNFPCKNRVFVTRIPIHYHNDDYPRALNDEMYYDSVSTYTITSCLALCKDYQYFALASFGHYCFCEDSLIDVTRYDKSSDCTGPFGNDWINQVYENLITQQIEEYSYDGWSIYSETNNVFGLILNPRENSSNGDVIYLGDFSSYQQCLNATITAEYYPQDFMSFTWVDGNGGLFAYGCYGRYDDEWNPYTQSNAISGRHPGYDYIGCYNDTEMISSTLHIEVYSKGTDNSAIDGQWCSFIKVNDINIMDQQMQCWQNYRGSNAVILDPYSGSVMDEFHADTYIDSSTDTDMANFLDNARPGDIILFTVYDTVRDFGTYPTETMNRLISYGCDSSIANGIEFREAFIFIGTSNNGSVSNIPSWTYCERAIATAPAILRTVELPVTTSRETPWNILFEKEEEFEIENGNILGYVDGYDNMYISFDAKFTAYPTTYSLNVFLIGTDTASETDDRYPGVYLGHNNDDFGFRLSSVVSQQYGARYDSGISPSLNTWYSLKIIYTQSSWEVYINDILRYSDYNFPRHELWEKKPIWIASNLNTAAQGNVSNVLIQGYNDNLFEFCHSLCSQQNYFVIYDDTSCGCRSSIDESKTYSESNNCNNSIGDGKNSYALYQNALDYKYIGCYNDNGITTALPIELSGKFTITACHKECLSQQYRYFAIQSYEKCFCSDDLKNAKKYGSTTACIQGVGSNDTNALYENLNGMYSCHFWLNLRNSICSKTQHLRWLRLQHHH